MQASQATKAKAWDAIDLSKIHPKKLKKMIREGVPKSLRRELWLDLSGGGTLREDFAKSHFLKLTSRWVLCKLIDWTLHFLLPL